VIQLGIISWLTDRLTSSTSEAMEIKIADLIELSIELSIRRLAFQSAVNLIANSISKCEFKTYSNNKEEKKMEYYLFNIEPNKNQNSSMFIHKWISKLYTNNECLIIEHQGQLLIADSFTVKKYALYDWTFSDVQIEEHKFSKNFKMKDVLYYQLNNDDIKQVIDAMYDKYGKLISFGQSHYKKSKGKSGILAIDAMAQGQPNFEETFEKLMNERFKAFFEADNAVLPLFEGYSYEELGSKTYSDASSRDIKAMIDDVYDFTARAFQIPPIVLKGDIAGNKDVIDQFLTFAIDPLADTLQEEVVRKRYGYDEFQKGNYLRIDTKTIKHIDLLSIATSIDKLISSSVFNVNDLRKAVNEPEINEPWANQHFITKNYSSVEAYLKELEGGDK
jgi:HK97 family phage portal protein